MNQQQYFIIPEGKVVVEADQLIVKLDQLAQEVNEKLPVGTTVEIRRTGNTQFTFSILNTKNSIVLQQFGIDWDPETKFVTWAAML